MRYIVDDLHLVLFLFNFKISYTPCLTEIEVRNHIFVHRNILSLFQFIITASTATTRTHTTPGTQDTHPRAPIIELMPLPQ